QGLAGAGGVGKPSTAGLIGPPAGPLLCHRPGTAQRPCASGRNRCLSPASNFPDWGRSSMSEQQHSIVRRSVRYDVSIRASISVLPEHGSLVRFAAGAGARDGWVDVDLVDFSSSGVGIM